MLFVNVDPEGRRVIQGDIQAKELTVARLHKPPLDNLFSVGKDRRCTSKVSSVLSVIINGLCSLS